MSDEMKFKPGDTVWLSSPKTVSGYGELSTEATICDCMDDGSYRVADGLDPGRIMKPEHVFPTQQAADTAGRALLPVLMQEERDRHTAAMGRLHKLNLGADGK
jgi:hypothetical protein